MVPVPKKSSTKSVKEQEKSWDDVIGFIKKREEGAGEPESPGTWKRRAAPRADVPSWSSHSGAFSLMVYAMLMERKMDFEEEPSLLVELLGKPQWNTKLSQKGMLAFENQSICQVSINNVVD